MPKLKEQPKWVLDLREDIKDQQRFGWSVREKKGSVEVIRYWADTGKRQSAVLPIEWRKENKRDILNALHGIQAALNKGLNLKDAVRLNFEVAAGPKPTTNWMEIFQRWKTWKLENGKVRKESSFDKNDGRRVLLLIERLESADAPTNGDGAIEAMRFNRQGEGAPGTRERRLRIEASAQFLNHAVDKCGASKRWRPDSAVIKDSIGELDDNTEQAPQAGQAVPLSDEQIIKLWFSINDTRWRNVVALLACFGLRGVELLYCRPYNPKKPRESKADGEYKGLWVTYTKHTTKGTTDERFVPYCNPKDFRIAQRTMRELAWNKDSALPPLGTTDGAVSGAISTYLNRNKVWKEFKAAAKEAGLGRISVYSFRHAFALRAAARGIPPRRAANAMGHSYKVHCDTYSKYVDMDGTGRAFEEAEERANGDGPDWSEVDWKNVDGSRWVELENAARSTDPGDTKAIAKLLKNSD